MAQQRDRAQRARLATLDIAVVVLGAGWQQHAAVFRQQLSRAIGDARDRPNRWDLRHRSV